MQSIRRPYLSLGKERGRTIIADVHFFCLTLVRRLVELDEESIMLLMKALALQKNKEAITRQYLQFAETQHKEIGMNPSLEAAALYKQLLSELDA
jgi:DNA-binding SARP family transcriptional activator